MTLFLECNADETLAMSLGITKREIRHSHGKGNVGNQMMKLTGVSGMVDEDPGRSEPVTFQSYKESARVPVCHEIRLRVDSKSENRLIVICPDLEQWLVRTADQAGVEMQKFSLSNDAGELHKKINSRPDTSKVRELLEELLRIGSPRLLYLRSLLRE